MSVLGGLVREWAVLCDNVSESGCFGHAHLAKVYLFLLMLAVVA